MNTFTAKDLQDLIESRRNDICSCASIYMPTYRTGADMLQGPSRFKNLLRMTGESFTATGMRSSDVSKTLAPAHKLLTDAFFWRNQAEGLAVFLCPEFLRYYRLPINFKEMVSVGERFNIKPLFPLLTGDGQYYVLAVSQKDIKLLQCTRFGYREVKLPSSVPTSLVEAMKYEDLDRSSQYHSHVGDNEYHGHIGSEAAGVTMISHGKSIAEENKDRILRYFHDVDHGLREILHDERSPLIFSGVEYLYPIYRQANTYSQLVKIPVTGNPDRVAPQGLHLKAWELIQPQFEITRLKSLAKYRQLAGTGYTSSDLNEIVINSYRGKIDTLFVDGTREQWGVFDRDTLTVRTHDKAESCDEDLLDLALTNTIVHKGTAFVLKKDELPDSLTASAVLRR